MGVGVRRHGPCSQSGENAAQGAAAEAADDEDELTQSWTQR